MASVHIRGSEYLFPEFKTEQILDILIRKTFEKQIIWVVEGTTIDRQKFYSTKWHSRIVGYETEGFVLYSSSHMVYELEDKAGNKTSMLMCHYSFCTESAVAKCRQLHKIVTTTALSEDETLVEHINASLRKFIYDNE